MFLGLSWHIGPVYDPPLVRWLYEVSHVFWELDGTFDAVTVPLSLSGSHEGCEWVLRRRPAPSRHNRRRASRA